MKSVTLISSLKLRIIQIHSFFSYLYKRVSDMVECLNFDKELKCCIRAVDADVDENRLERC